jgi:hypothetical protein
MEESETFWEPQEGEALVPAVEPADVKAAWQVYHDAEVRMPGQQVAIGRSVFEHVCSPGADISSVTYRTVQLLLLFHIAAEAVNEPDARKILEWQHGDKLDRLFEVMSRIPIKWLPKEGTHSFPPNVDDFVKQVEEAA